MSQPKFEWIFTHGTKVLIWTQFRWQQDMSSHSSIWFCRLALTCSGKKSKCRRETTGPLFIIALVSVFCPSALCQSEAFVQRTKVPVGRNPKCPFPILDGNTNICISYVTDKEIWQHPPGKHNTSKSIIFDCPSVYVLKLSHNLSSCKCLLTKLNFKHPAAWFL